MFRPAPFTVVVSTRSRKSARNRSRVNGGICAGAPSELIHYGLLERRRSFLGRLGGSAVWVCGRKCNPREGVPLWKKTNDGQ